MAETRFKSTLMKGRESSLNKLMSLFVPKNLVEVFVSANPKAGKRLRFKEVSWVELFHNIKKRPVAVPNQVKDAWIDRVTNNLTKSGDDFLYKHTGHSSMKALIKELVEFHIAARTKVRNITNYATMDVTSNSISQVKGELLHRVIEESDILWRHLRRSGNLMVDWANFIKGRQDLVDIRGRSVLSRLGKLKFCRVKRASDVKIKFKEPITLKDGSKITEVQFMDNLLISHTGDTIDVQSFVHVTTSLESKTVKAASGFTEQISAMLARGNDPNIETISMRLETGETIDVYPSRMVFNTKNLDQIAVSTMSDRQLSLRDTVNKELDDALRKGDLDKVFDMANMRFSSTEKNGGTTFLRIDLPIKDAYLERVAKAIVTSEP